jgi:uncharacterized protein YndB with AHSA1/START domain
MARYNFTTTWQLEAPIEAVWPVIYDTLNWPRWWKGVEQVVRLESGDAQGEGAVDRYTWKSVLPYRLTFDVRATKIEPPRYAEGESLGDLKGSGKWQLSQDSNITTVHYLWEVETTKLWMNLLEPIARPIFNWNHNIVMKNGGKGLAELLNARLLKNSR